MGKAVTVFKDMCAAFRPAPTRTARAAPWTGCHSANAKPDQSSTGNS